MEEVKQATNGEKLAGVSFNPSQNPDVAEVKEMFAKVIDKLFDKGQNFDDSDRLGTPIYNNAIAACMDAQMWAVKALTWS